MCYAGLRPSKWIHKKDATFVADPQPSVADSILAHIFNFIIIDKIIYLSQPLKVLNESVRVLQIATFHQRQKVDEQETERQQNVHGKIEAHATLVAGKFLSSNVKSFQSVTQKMTEMFRLVGGSILPAPVIADAGMRTFIRTYTDRNINTNVPALVHIIRLHIYILEENISSLDNSINSMTQMPKKNTVLSMLTLSFVSR